jgi:cation:H+ antiporter
MHTDARITQLEGLILFVILITYLIWQFIRVKNQRNGNSAEVDDMPESTSDVKKIALFLIIGVIGLPIGAYLTVESASSIARSFDISEAIIGVTVVAIGTSLPELITSVMAAIRRSGGVALGNVVGSNIFNIGLILGSTALIHPLDVDPHFMNFDIPMMVFASLILVLLAVLSKPLQTWGGALMLVGYTSYVSLSF